MVHGWGVRHVDFRNKCSRHGVCNHTWGIWFLVSLQLSFFFFSQTAVGWVGLSTNYTSGCRLTLFNGGGHSTNSWNSVRVKQTCKSEFHKCQRFLGISLLSVFLFCFLVWWAMQVLQKHLPGSLWWIYFFKDKIKCPWSFIEEFPSRNPYSHSISNKWLEGVNRNLWAILTTVLGELGGWSESGVWGSVVGIPWFLKVFSQSRNLSFSYPGSIGWVNIWHVSIWHVNE